MTFNSARFLRFIRPLDIITYNAGTNFASIKFRFKVKIIGITCKQVLAVNDTASLDGLVPTLLVFDAYPQKAMKALRRAVAERVVSNALNTRNRPNIDKLLLLPLQRLYKVINIKNHDVTIDIVNGLTTF
ncbi:hypothetical protein BU23DRAFT_585840 [Bimuria novae-zelandiae CBS 107.79]|uniref:Integrase catalytic domain-containing protein n=1 Tax=Bimuria novae-zelandiae CBS 107.79 TaxID=1447943 RepID=A0A6A5UG48_9PLEO|nr:hypothetical protein BU23DRAFT_585840 [Bimuria novae-zelandiae CBS 107.79]